MTHKETADWVNGKLDKESAEVLMLFVDYLFENGFTFDGEHFYYLEQMVGLIHIYGTDDWWIYLIHEAFEHEKFPFDAEMTEFMRSQAKLQTWCGGRCKNCKDPEEYMLFGKAFDNICKSIRLAFGRFNTAKVVKIDAEQCFDAERMKLGLRAMDKCMEIIKYRQSV
jgi:hypothetical protein